MVQPKENKTKLKVTKSYEHASVVALLDFSLVFGTIFYLFLLDHLVSFGFFDTHFYLSQLLLHDLLSLL